VLTGATRLLCTWRAFQQLLNELASTPMHRTFHALRDQSMESLVALSQNVAGSQFELFRKQMLYANALLELAGGGLDDSPIARFQRFGKRFSAQQTESLPPSNYWGKEEFDDPPCSMRVLAREAATYLITWLETQWPLERLDVTEFPSAAADDRSTIPDTPLSTREEVRLSEAFVCILYISFIQVILARIKSIIFACSAVLISMMLAVAFYPFAPRNAVTAWLLLLLLGLGAVVTIVYAGMERNKVLSLITNTSTRLGWEFWVHFTTFLVPTLLALVTAQFPEASDFISSWIPAFGAK
jgi:hypothetical protein